VIGWLSGTVRWVDKNVVLVDAHGVGYEVHTTQPIARDARVGTSLSMFVHTSVREDAITLYGFTDAAERSIFRLLISSPGIGPATGLAFLSTLSPTDITAAIANEDVAILTQVPGIGKKTASRLILEMSGSLPDTSSGAAPIRADIAEALSGLGYGASEIRSALDGLELPDNEGDALRIALRQLGKP
jgi:Holliday junction DNA helicase RuvA